MLLIWKKFPSTTKRKTNIKKIKFVIDLFEARKHIENSTPKINDWLSFDLGSIVVGK
jgi:hypothetical protein